MTKNLMKHEVFGYSAAQSQDLRSAFYWKGGVCQQTPKLLLYSVCVIAFLAAAAFPAQAAAQTATPAGIAGRSKISSQLNGVGFDQRLDAAIPLSAEFHDETGRTVKLGSFFHGKPVILATVYYRCPMLCSQILSGVVRGLRPLSLSPGRDFEVVAVSINPDETPEDGKDKRDLYSRQYSKSAGTAGWHFLVGSETSIRSVTDAIGFHYRYDPSSKMFFHASGITVVTPEGRVSRYLYGVDYEPKDLKLSLIDASHRQIGSPVDQVLLFCYHYDPATGKYSTLVLQILKLAAIGLLAILAAGLTWLWRRDLRQHAVALKQETSA